MDYYIHCGSVDYIIILGFPFIIHIICKRYTGADYPLKSSFQKILAKNNSSRSYAIMDWLYTGKYGKY